MVADAGGGGVGEHAVGVLVGALEADGLESVLGFLDALLEGHAVEEELLARLLQFAALGFDDLFHLVELLKLDLELLQCYVDGGAD